MWPQRSVKPCWLEGTSWLSLAEESLVIFKSMTHTSITLSNRSTERERDYSDAWAALWESEQDCGTLSTCHDAHVGLQLGFSDDGSNPVFEEQFRMQRVWWVWRLHGIWQTEFREALLKTIAPMTVDKLMKTITPPKGVRIRESSDVPPDEGKE